MMVNRVWILIGKKVSGEATQLELEELECLLADGGEGNQTVTELEQLWRNTKPDIAEQSQYQIDSRWQRFKTKLSDDKRISGIKLLPITRRWMVAASCAFLVLTAGLVQLAGKYNINNRSYTTVEAPDGETSEVKLPDGSKVWLNAGSRITYKKEFGQRLREVNLIGEAYFDVVKDGAHPFIVTTTSLHLRVLGTAFNVRSFPGERKSEASLIRGAVEVTLVNNPDKKIILKPTEKITVRNDAFEGEADEASNNQTSRTSRLNAIPLMTLSNIHYKEEDPLPVEAQWIEKKLAFESENLEDIASRMQRYYGVNIKFKDESVKVLAFSGSFKDETVTEAITALQTTGGYQFNFKIEDNNITIYK